MQDLAPVLRAVKGQPMSILGTSIAAGVAQTALQAQQVARGQDRQSARIRDEGRRVREMFEAHLRSLEEGDEDETVDRVQIDGQLPEHVSSANPDRRRQPSHTLAKPASDDNPHDAQTTESLPADEGEDALYQHLDVQA